MAFLKKMFRGKDKVEENEEGPSSERHGEAPRTPPMDDKRRLRNNLSVSRSGRYKQKKKERGALLNQPELFDGPDSKDPHQNMNTSPQQQRATANSYNRTPNGSYSKCRGIEPPTRALASNSSLSRQSARV